jgi:N-acetylglucosaminyl-diphospho-decaprenol L-rhamnosyltransferase
MTIVLPPAQSDSTQISASNPAPCDISVIVVTYRSEETIDACLHRLRAAEGVAAIRVVDNASTDSTLAIVQRHAVADARVRFIANPDNPGFGTASNQGAFVCTSTWLAFVNPDCLVEPDTLARLCTLAQTSMQADGREVLIGADLVDEAGVRDGAARRRDPDFYAMLGSKSARRLDIAADDMRALQYVPAASGALMCVRRDFFERLRGFDQDYRLHAEDLDLCRRVREAGGVVAVANNVRVVHVRGVSSRSRPWFVEWHKHRGLAHYFRKFEARQRNPLVRLCVYAMIWVRFPFAALRAARRS